MTKALQSLRIVDLSRVLAGPSCTQILGDLGAEIIKIERPYAGDDTRNWGPPFLKDKDSNDTTESAYYLSINRNKKSLALDISTEKGQAIIHDLLQKSDVLIENFKVGSLKKYGLDYEQIKDRHPHLIYCAITGFGQTGPICTEPGYDILAQAMTGLMACTGEPDGQPVKVGVALSDVMAGLNAAIGILAALQSRHETGKGQLVDIALTDVTLAALTNIAQYYLTSGKVPPRVGNAHSTIVPYQSFKAKDGHIIIAVGNDSQFARLCESIEMPELAQKEDFVTNPARVANRHTLVPLLQKALKNKTVQEWMEILYDKDVPCSPVNTVAEAFENEQIKSRNMRIEMDHPLSDRPTSLIGSPLKLSDTPVHYEHSPPYLGQHTQEILQRILQYSPSEIDSLIKEKIIQADKRT